MGLIDNKTYGLIDCCINVDYNEIPDYFLELIFVRKIMDIFRYIKF